MFTPTIVKVLNYLKDTKVKKTKEELSISIDEPQEYVNKALEKLIAIDVVTQEEGDYLYNDTPSSGEFCYRLAKLYETLGRKPNKELLIRGLICQIPSQYLFHFPTLVQMMQKEGIDKQELDQFLEQEIANGYLKIIRAVYTEMEPPVIPICIPPFYFNYLGHLGVINCDWYKSHRQEQRDYELWEEDYLIAQYPSELANPAKEYIEGERKELKNNFRSRELVSWGGGLWRFR